MHHSRKTKLDCATREIFDVAIVGGGINGSCLYHQLNQQGYRVLLIDKSDFSGGTSQSSAMMIWGGLLYLRNFDLKSVFKFSRDRDLMVKNLDRWVTPNFFRYIPSPNGIRNKYFMYSALYFYWLIGLCNRNRPRLENEFQEKGFIQGNGKNTSLLFEEASLLSSDANFVLNWITENAVSENCALNYCELQSGDFHSKDRLWHLKLKNGIEDESFSARSKVVINCAGVWTDTINDRFHIQSPYKHVFSKGVTLGLKRNPEHRLPLIFEMGEHGDTLLYKPWGPIALWGSTETFIKNISDGFQVGPEDVAFLLDKANGLLKDNVGRSDIVSLRCGVRPLAVKRSFSKDCYPLDLSRQHAVVRDPEVPWLSTYGGKITSCFSLSEKIASHIKKMIGVGEKKIPSVPDFPKDTERCISHGLKEPFPSMEWCMENQSCVTLEDYLRRRTNISQWTAREGLGKEDEYLPDLKNLALKISANDEKEADLQIDRYREQVVARFDRVVNQV